MFKPLSFVATAALGFACFASPAMAQDVKLFEWRQGNSAALITTKDGFLMIHKDGKPFRAYTYRPNKNSKAQPALVVMDFNRDGEPEVVGMGKPTFAISAKGDPLWSMKKGCKQGFLANVANDSKMEVVCTNGQEIKVYTHDAQFVWGLSLGRSFKDCIAGDTNGDLFDDIECKVGNKIARVDGATGKLITATATESMISTTGVESIAALGTDDLKGKKMYDINKDGTAEESLEISGNTLAIVSKSSPKKPIAVVDLGSAPVNAIVRDLDGDGKLETLALTKTRYFVISSDGKRQESYPLSFKKYKRKPVAEFENVYATNYKDNDAAAKAIKALQDQFSKCYAGALKKSKFAGSGKLLMEATSDKSGKVTKAEKIHSQIADKKVVACAMRVIKKAKLPEHKDNLTPKINVTMVFTFRDAAK